MQKQITTIDFEGQPFYVGLDVHLKNWAVTIRTRDFHLKTFSMNPDPRQLLSHLEHNYPGGDFHSVYEAGFSGFWIHRTLEELGFKSIVINPADVPTTHWEKQRRRDAVDSRKLSRELANNSLTSIYIPDPFHEELRSLCRLYHRCVNHRTRLKNRVRSFLYRHNVAFPSKAETAPWSGRFITWLRSLEFDEEAAQINFNFCLEELQEARQRTKTIVQSLKELSRKSPIQSIIHDYLMSVPGVGFITAITFYTEIVDITRFSNFDHLASYIGLVPDTDSSGEHDVTTCLTHRRNRQLRYMIIEAAWVAVRKDPALTQSFLKLTQRMKKQQAIIRTAKKLLRRMRYVWLNEETYATSVVS